MVRGWPDGKIDMNMTPYHCRRDELCVQGCCVLLDARVVIPSQYRQEVLHEMHFAHPGISRMKSLARSCVWWPAMDRESWKKWFRSVSHANCITCHHPLLHYILGSGRRSHIDYAGPFLCKMFLVVVDATSKRIETYTMNSTTSTATVCKLREIFAKHGLPEILV